MVRYHAIVNAYSAYHVELSLVLNHKFINKWGLFWMISAPISLLVMLEMLATDLSSGEGVSHMIGYAVRWAVPLIFIVIGASSLRIVFPSPFSNWLARNRKYLGLCFAVAMFWQGLFIFIVSVLHREYYFSDIYYFRDELEGTIGYLFLAAMTATSFAFGRRLVNPTQWKIIHKCGVYFLWAYPFSVYWWNLFYYPTLEPFTDPRAMDYVLYAVGFTAFALRIAAWGKTRIARNGDSADASTLHSALGGLIILMGVIASISGRLWQKSVSEYLTGSGHVAELPLWLPFWPLEPFLPLFAIGLGTMLLTHRSARN